MKGRPVLASVVASILSTALAAAVNLATDLGRNPWAWLAVFSLALVVGYVAAYVALDTNPVRERRLARQVKTERERWQAAERVQSAVREVDRAAQRTVVTSVQATAGVDRAERTTPGSTRETRYTVRIHFEIGFRTPKPDTSSE